MPKAASFIPPVAVGGATRRSYAHEKAPLSL
jgi:hypothetical protein